MVNVLFVCLGNICRSPTAEGVFRRLVETEGLSEKFTIDSAGTGGWHTGGSPDKRAQAVAKKRGLNLSNQKSRKISSVDFNKFDYVIAMDQQNLEDLSQMCPPDKVERLSLFLSYAPDLDRTEVPDPYYFGSFDAVFDMIEIASAGLLSNIRANHEL